MGLLEIESMRAGYEGIPVVFGIDLEIADGSITALLGANGAGKTTTLRAISGMIRPMSGSIVFDGTQISGMPAERVARRGLVHVPQGRGIFPSLGVEESLRLACALAKLGPTETPAAIDRVYAAFPNLAARRKQPGGTLSGGEQQMLALARAFIARPRLLMVDEMSQGLAPTIAAGLFEMLDSFPAQGTAVLLVEQFVGQALAVAHRACVMEKGKITFTGPSSELAANEEFMRSSYLGDATPANRRARANTTGEAVDVHLPPVLLRSLQERAAREQIDLDVLLRDLVEHATEDTDGSRRTTVLTKTKRKGKRHAS